MDQGTDPSFASSGEERYGGVIQGAIQERCAISMWLPALLEELSLASGRAATLRDLNPSAAETWS